MSDITSRTYPVVSTVPGGAQFPIVTGGQLKKATTDAMTAFVEEVIADSVPEDFLDNLVQVTQASDLQGGIDSSKIYRVTRPVDMTGVTVFIPEGGLNIEGYNFNVSGLFTTGDGDVLFQSDTGGSGDLVMKNMYVSVSGAGAQVFDLTGATGDEALELEAVNFNNCTSRGEINNYRQGLETGGGYFGGTPELTLSGAWSGYRLDTVLAIDMDDFTSLFQAGTGLEFSSRFITNMNVDLPANGALFDFAEANFANDETFVIADASITRGGVSNPEDTTIIPNIDQTSVKSRWSNNTGIRNTKEYIKGRITAEVATTFSAPNTYTPLLGTLTIDTEAHFDSPANGQLRLLVGAKDINVFGTIKLEGTAGNIIDLRVTKSTDGGATFPTQIDHIAQDILNLSGPTDYALYTINTLGQLNKDDIIRLEVENNTSTASVTQALDSFLIAQTV